MIRPYVCDTSVIVQDCVKTNKKVLFEGAQGTLLDVNYGTYPYVTSSHPKTAGVCVGAGVPPTAIHEVVGIAKAYTTRGQRPFPTSCSTHPAINSGKSFSTDHHSARRCGWYDTVVVGMRRD